jgi:ABC-type multidrug transport system ATPase subunit
MGRNGSGKTTLINTLLGKLPKNGKIEYDPLICDSKKRISNKEVFFVSDSPFTYDYLTGMEFVEFILMVKAEKNVERGRVLEFFEFFGLSEEDSRKLMKNYSFGMKRKTLLTAGFLMKPSLMILDEPTIGLDVPSVISLKKLINEYSKSEKTILVTSHDPSLMSELCQSLIVLDSGKAVYQNDNFKEEAKDLATLYLELVGENINQKIATLLEN